MQIIKRHAGAKLFDRACLLGHENTDIWRCLYIRLAAQGPLSQSLRINFVERSIEEALADLEGQVFFCEDGDIFILFKGAVRPVAARLSLYFDEVKPEMDTAQPSDELFTFLDLGMYWQVFMDLCRAKYIKTHRSAQPHGDWASA
jgi:hypothetical protein